MAQNEPKPTGLVGVRVKPPEATTPAEMTTQQLAERALATQGKPMTLAQLLPEDVQQALASTLDENGLATGDLHDEDTGEVITTGTAAVVREAIRDYYAEQKAVDGDAEDGAVGPVDLES